MFLFFLENKDDLETLERFVDSWITPRYNITSAESIRQLSTLQTFPLLSFWRCVSSCSQQCPRTCSWSVSNVRGKVANHERLSWFFIEETDKGNGHRKIENSWKHRNTKYRTAAAWFSVKQFYKLVRTMNSSESKMCRHTCGQDSLDWESKKPLKILSTTLCIRIYKEFILATWENHSIASIHITRKDRWHSGSFPGLSNCTAQFRGVRLPGDPHDLSQSHSILIICRTLQNKDIKDI